MAVCVVISATVEKSATLPDHAWHSHICTRKEVPGACLHTDGNDTVDGMKSQFLARLLTTQLLAVSATLAPAGDIDREWEAEIAENLDENTSDGEVIWCQAANSRFLTLYTGQTANHAKGAAIILHGMGAHPDWPQVISPLRTSLPELGWSTLSIQLPV